MQVSAVLHEKELNEAIMAHVIKKGYPVEGMEISITLTKGRTKGDYATVVFIPEGGEIFTDEPDGVSQPSDTTEEEPVAQEEEGEPEEPAVVEETPPFENEQVVEDLNPKKSLFS
jgi:hypothetical protein